MRPVVPRSRAPTRTRLIAFAAALSWCCVGMAVDSTMGPAKTPFASDQSDLWWVPTESGWGMQIIQQSDVLFATLFVYDASGAPTFFTATLVANGTLAWAGDLYRTTGPYFGAPTFDPATTAYRRVGTLSFSRPTSEAGALEYSVDGVVVTKNVSRMLLVYDNYGGHYVATVHMVSSNCPVPADNGDTTQQFRIDVTQDRQAMGLHWIAPDGTTCDFGGAYAQQGRIGQFAANYLCSTSERGNMAFFEMTHRVGMIAGQFRGHSDNTGCDRGGSFTGLVPE
jgi:hypothetical protein